MTIRSETLTLTPDAAKMLLERNTGNRPVRRSMVNYLAHEIRNGRWLTTADGIGIASTGRILNGQHRLLAIIEAGIPVQVVLTHGLDEASFKVTDNGNKRSISDNTGLPAPLTSDVSLLLYIMQGKGGSGSQRVSPQVAEDAVEWYGPAYHAVQAGINNLKRAGLDNTAVRLGMALRWATEQRAKDRQYVLNQYRFMLLADPQNMSRAAATLWARLQRKGSVGASRDDRVAAVAHVYHAMDPRRSAVAPIVRDASEIKAELRQWGLAMQDAYIAGPAKDGHPYAWQSRPTVERKAYGAAAKVRDEKRAREANP